MVRGLLSRRACLVCDPGCRRGEELLSIRFKDQYESGLLQPFVFALDFL